MELLRLIGQLVGVGLLLLGLASVWMLFKLKGGSDGPGAILFYLGALVGLGGAVTMFWLLRPIRLPGDDET